MKFSYSGSPNASILDEVRFLIQDTDSGDIMLSDKEIEYLIVQNKTALKSALAACQILIAKFARAVDEQLGKQTLYASQMQAHFKTCAQNLEKLITNKSTQVFIGGTSNKKQFTDFEGDNFRVCREL